MKILVTGAAGFVGRNLVESLSMLGIELVAVDNLDSTLYPSRFKLHNFESIEKLNGVKCIRLNLASDPIPDSIVECDVVINLAALPGQLLSWEKGKFYNASNYLIVENLLTGFLKSGKFPKWIQASTSSVYGREAIQGENGPCSPCNPYGVTKLAAEKLLQAYHAYYDFPLTILRYFSIYGPYQRPDMAIHKFLRNLNSGIKIPIYGDGLQTRDLTFVSDAIDATHLSIYFESSDVEVFNISGGGIYSALQIAETCQEITGIKGLIEFIDRPIGDQLNTMGNSNKARSVLGYSPKVELSTGIEKQWRNFLNIKRAIG